VTAGTFGLLLYLHLAFMGRVVSGRSARIPAGGVPDDNGPVLYFYMVNGETYSGWRRGIQWGEQPIAVLYSPLWARVHVTSTDASLQTPRAWLRDPDFLLRLALWGTVLAFGLVTLVLGARLDGAIRWMLEGFRVPADASTRRN